MPSLAILRSLAVGGALLALAVTPAANARSSELRVVEYPVNVQCTPPSAVGAYCAQSYTVGVRTAGRLFVTYWHLPGADPRDTCTIGDAEIGVDGEWRASQRISGHGRAVWDLTGIRPGGHTLMIRTRRTNAGCGEQYGFSGTVTIATSVPQVGALNLTFRERRDTAREQLADLARRVLARKQAIDREIDAARERVQDAVGRQQAVQAKAQRMFAHWRATRAALGRLANAERRLPQQGVEAHRAVVAQIGADIAALEGRIVGATRAGASTQALAQNLRRKRRNLAAVEAGIVERGPAATRDLRRRWLGLARDLRELLHDLHVENAATEKERAVANDALLRLLRERTQLDEQALDGAVRLSQLDFDVNEVRVRANGREVYRADGSSGVYEQLREIQRNLDLAEQAEQALRPEFDRLRFAFYAAQRETIAAEADLASRLSTLAIARYVTDVAFAFIDVAAAYASSGPVGAVTELLKKAAETAISQNTVVASGVAPGSVEAEINARYRAGLKEAFSGPQLMKVGMERVAKETLLKPAKDALNAGLAQAFFGPLGHTLQTAVGPGGKELNPTALRALIRAPERLGHTDAQVKKLRTGGFSLRGLGLSLLKDVAKTVHRSALDDYEREAWIRFFEADLYARARYALYVTARDYYAQAEDAKLWYEQRKLAILARQVDPNTGFIRRLTEPFEIDAQLEIEVRAASGLEPSELTLVLQIGGKRLLPTARRRDGDFVVLTYGVNAAELDSGAEGAIAVEIR